MLKGVTIKKAKQSLCPQYLMNSLLEDPFTTPGWRGANINQCLAPICLDQERYSWKWI